MGYPVLVQSSLLILCFSLSVVTVSFLERTTTSHTNQRERSNTVGEYFYCFLNFITRTRCKCSVLNVILASLIQFHLQSFLLYLPNSQDNVLVKAETYYIQTMLTLFTVKLLNPDNLILQLVFQRSRSHSLNLVKEWVPKLDKS